jgi:hypothetical protein
MSTIKCSLAYLAVVSVLSIGSLGLVHESAAAVPEKASSQQEEIGSASLVVTPSPAPTLQ